MSAEIMRGVVFLGDRVAEVRDFPKPQTGRGQVLVKLKTAAICGSDLHTYRRPAADFMGQVGADEEGQGTAGEGVVEFWI